MRPRKFLLVTKALTAASLAIACKKEDMPPPPGNPKGNWAEQDSGPVAPLPANPKASDYEVPRPQDPAAIDAGPDGTPRRVDPLPGNPKGSHYDKTPPPPTVTARPPVIGPPANPKGSHYDAGLKKP